jgi:imidazolonepropionase-like amidohydrolase
VTADGVIDGSGKYLLPGGIDVHTHMAGDRPRSVGSWSSQTASSLHSLDWGNSNALA